MCPKLRLLFVSVTCLCPGLCLGQEIFYLRSGFSLEAQSHVRRNLASGDVFTLTTVNGTIEVRASEVDRIETVPDPAPAESTLASPSQSQTVTALAGKRMEEIVSSAAFAQGLPSEFIRSVAKVESGMQPAAVSPKGAVGLMQLMPGTAADLKVVPTDPADNALGGARYLRELLIRYHNDAALALAAYNAGPGAVDKFGGVPPYPETRQYIVRVLKEYARQQAVAKSGPKKTKATSGRVDSTASPNSSNAKE